MAPVTSQSRGEGRRSGRVSSLQEAEAEEGTGLRLTQSSYWSNGVARPTMLANEGSSLSTVGENLFTAGPGASFGELSLLHGKKRALTAIC